MSVKRPLVLSANQIARLKSCDSISLATPVICNLTGCSKLSQHAAVDVAVSKHSSCFVDMDDCNSVDFLLKNKFINLDIEVQRKVVQLGRATPNLQLLESNSKQNRKFRFVWYGKKEWMTGCATRKRLFCFPCLLFTVERDGCHPWTVKGFNDLGHLSVAANKHEQSLAHIQSAVKLKILFKETPISQALSEIKTVSIEAHNAEVRRNHEVFRRLIDACVYLAQTDLAFCNHCESENSPSQRHFRELCSLLCKYDQPIREYLRDDSTFEDEDFKTILSDLLSAIAMEIKKTIHSEVEKSNYFTIICDETTDGSTRSQLSIFVRYELNGSVYKRFLGVKNISPDENAEKIAKVIFENIETFNPEQKLVAQTYDGCSTMVGSRNGVQTFIREAFPMAIYIHNYANSLNLSLSRACSSNTKVKIFFSDLAAFSVFFHDSSRRREFFSTFFEWRESKLVIPAVSAKWYSDYRDVAIVFENLDVLRRCFSSIRDKCEWWDNSSIHQAGALLDTINNFDFLFLLNVFHQLLPLTQKLQDASSLFEFAFSFATQTLNDLKCRRNDEEFAKLFTCAQLMVKADSDDSKIRSSLAFLSDSSEEYRYKVLYFDVINLLIENVETRFKDINQLKFPLLLQKDKFPEFCQNFPIEVLKSLQESVYSHLFDFGKLKAELSVVYSFANFQLNICDFLQFICDRDMKGTLPEITKLLKLILAMPVTSVPDNNLFSCLNRVETILKTTTAEERLPNLFLVSMEKELAANVDHEQVIRFFAEMKDRKIKLFFK